MSKHLSVAAAVGFAALMALPTVSEAHCLHAKRWEARTTAVFTETGHAVRRVGDGIVRTSDRMFGWIFHCKRHRWG
jgi:hypothetical protein